MSNIMKSKSYIGKLSALDWIAISVIILALIGVIVFPYCATRYSWFDLSPYGGIGDAIGGTTAPVIGLTAAILVYLSFRAQMIANEILGNQITELSQTKYLDYLFDEVTKRLEKVYNKIPEKNLRIALPDGYGGYTEIENEGKDKLKIYTTDENLWKKLEVIFDLMFTINDEFDKRLLSETTEKIYKKKVNILFDEYLKEMLSKVDKITISIKEAWGADLYKKVDPKKILEEQSYYEETEENFQKQIAIHKMLEYHIYNLYQFAFKLEKESFEEEVQRMKNHK